MLATLLAAGELPLQVQRRLFDALDATKDFPGLAQLCHLADLDPEIDDKLAKVPNAKVRSAWLTRPGRKVEEVTAMVAKERRVTVLAELAALDVSVPGFFDPLAANDHHRVQFALVMNPAAPLEVRNRAGRTLCARSSELSWEKQHRLVELWSTHPELCSGPLEVAGEGRMMRVLMLAPSASPKAVANVVRYIRHLASDVVSVAAANPSRWAVESRVALLCEIAQLALTAAWCDEPSRQMVVDTVASVVASPAHAAVGRSHQVELDAIVNHLVDDDSDLMGELVAAAACAADEDLPKLFAQLHSLPDSRAHRVLLEVLRNDSLSVASQLETIAHMPWRQRRELASVGFGDKVECALVLAGVAANRRPEVLELVLANLPTMDPSSASKVVTHLVCENVLDADQLLALPCQLLHSTLVPRIGHVPAADAVARRVGQRLAAELAEEPEVVWTQFRTLAPGFAGSTAQLLEVCRASVA